MDDLREPAKTPTVACPRCARDLAIDAGSTETACSCGFTAATSYLIEADYLRRGLPQWQQRLADLETKIAAGERPAAPAEVHHGPAAYQIILAVGGFLIVAGIAAFSAIIESAWALPIQIALILGTGWVTVRLRERMSATSGAMALATAGAWWFMLFWLSMAFSDGHWWAFDRWFPTTAAATTAVVLLSAALTWRVRVWSFLGAVFAALTPVLASVWLVMTLNGETSLNHGLANAVVGAPIGVLALLAYQQRVRFFPEGHLGQFALASLLGATTAVYTLSSLPWVPAWSVCLAWAGVYAVFSWLAHTHERTRIAVPVLVPLALAGTAGLTFLSLWGCVAVYAAALALLLMRPETSWAKPWSVLVAYISWLVVANIAFEDLVERTHMWFTLAVSAATAIALVWLAPSERRAWLLLPAWPISLVAVGQALDLADASSLEQYTLPFAVVTLGIGLLALSLLPNLPSVVWLGPAAVVGLIPSCFAALGTSPGTRFWLVLAATVAMLVVGTLMNLGGLLLTGTLAAVIVAFQPLSDPNTSIPKWVSFAAAGVVLVLVGARFESLRSSITADKARERLAMR
ncbi:MAG: hypothetical protein KGP01_02790 [Actinomycetales bacterium]|nr:hypothetical protein [Actinomycetales bacterium]